MGLLPNALYVREAFEFVSLAISNNCARPTDARQKKNSSSRLRSLLDFRRFLPNRLLKAQLLNFKHGGFVSEP